VVGSSSNESPASAAAAHRMGASCACIRPPQPAFREPSAPHSLFLSLSASSDFSDVAMLPARLAGTIIPALMDQAVNATA